MENGQKKKSEIAKEFGIPPNTLSTYLKNKEKILNSVCKASDKDRKRARGPENSDVDECVVKWFKQARDKKIPVSGPLARAKAEEFASSLGKNDFKASTGWLDGFKEMCIRDSPTNSFERHAIPFFKTIKPTSAGLKIIFP